MNFDLIMFAILSLILIVLIIGTVIYLVRLLFNFNDTSQELLLFQEKKYNKYLREHGMDRKDFEDEIDKILLRDKSGKISENSNKIADEKIGQWNSKELDLCDDFIRDNPNNLYAIDRRASLYNIIGRYHEAINDYKYLIKKEPRNFIHVKECAKTYANLNDINTARILIDNFYKRKKRDINYFFALGEIFENSQNYELAIENYTKAIELDPKNQECYFKRGLAYLKIGEKDKSQQDMKKNKELSLAHYIECRLDYENFRHECLTYRQSNAKFAILVTIFILTITFVSQYLIDLDVNIDNIVFGLLITIVVVSVCALCIDALVKRNKNR